MSNEQVQYAFVSGELAPQLFGRSDLTKYDLALAEAQNWYVNYQGGLSTRPGLEFCEYIKSDTQSTKFMNFRFSPDSEDIYVLLFGQNYVRFLQDGQYLLEASKAITAISGIGLVTSAGHGYATGDWVKIFDVVGMTQVNARTFIVSDSAANTFRLFDPLTLTYVDASSFDTYVSGGTVARVYTVATPYAATDLANLKGYQIRDTIRLTNSAFPIYNLTRFADTTWTCTAETIADYFYGPQNVSCVASAAGDASTVYAVSAIMADGVESAPGSPTEVANIVNFAVDPGSVKISWDPLAGASSYVLYRAIINSEGVGVSAGAQLGYLGTTTSTFFIDSNIIPDFTRAPKRHANPFASAAIEELTITNGGSGYSFYADLNATGFGGSGTGFRALALVDDAGVLTNTFIINGGSGYVAPVTISITGAGTGAVITGTVGSATGNYPAVSTVFQQRQVYGATADMPLGIFGSVVRQFSNFNVSPQITDADSYEFEIDSQVVAPIRHLLSVRGGLLAMSEEGVWLLSGSGANAALTPSDALADPQTFTGVGKIPPLRIGPDLLYVDARGYTVRLLSFNDLAKVYAGEDKSILSSHLFGYGKSIVDWDYMENPAKLVQCVREDGVQLVFTIVREQDVFAWTRYTTQGRFRTLIVSKEAEQDRTYVTVQRYIDGRLRTFVERHAFRSFTHVEDAWCLDSALKIEPPSIATFLTITVDPTADNMYLLTAGSAVFPGRVGQIVRAAGGIFVITVVGTTTASAYARTLPTQYIPETTIVAPVGSGAWSMGPEYTVVTGLWHLEGMSVRALGDGNVFPDQVVTDGQYTFTDPVSKAIIGLPYTCIAKTLPPTSQQNVIEARRKRLVGIGVRLHESRGLKNGYSTTNLYPLRERTSESFGTPITPLNGIKYQILEADWDENAQTYFVQDEPLPVTILAIIPDLEVGDDPA